MVICFSPGIARAHIIVDELSKEKMESFLFNVDFHWNGLRKYPRIDSSALFKNKEEFLA
jgi:hypothetical protein